MKNIKNIIEQKYPPENPNDLWMKDNVLYKSTHKGWTPLTASGSSSANGVTPTTWLELKDKRDAGKLTPGALYRITDYNCTTTQENTQSAGHQFDIVLLALSANKLAEEGWAMMHDNIYDVTFADGVTKKCYIYYTGEEDAEYNIVDVITLMGTGYVPAEMLTIDEETKTAIYVENSDTLLEEDVIGNYFQNSNLSAWKVWYCLDNDTARFAWADDTYKLNPASIICDCYRAGNIKVDGPIDYSGKQFVNGTIYYRDEENDTIIPNMGNVPAYAWTSENNITIFTLSITPNSFDTTYAYNTGGSLSSINGGTHGVIFYKTTSYVEGLPNYDFPNGRGVIYRLIDEWNNDVAYDFKNIQYKTKLDSDGFYNRNGNDFWTYSLNCYDADNSICYDASIVCATLVVSDMTLDCNNNFISCIIGDRKYKLQYNQLFTNYSFGDEITNSACFIKMFDSKNVRIGFGNNIKLYDCSSFDMKYEGDAIYIINKKVLTEE